MAEYWVSKKKHFCELCNQWMADDAPSRRLHETGLKHQGNKERYIRDLYRGGERAKRDKEAEKLEIARIEAAANAAYAHDKVGQAGAGRPAPRLHPSAFASSSSSASRIRKSAPTDKWANYSTASQLGFDDEETQKTSYEIEQEIKGRSTQVGAWEEVHNPGVQYDQYGIPESIRKRKAEEEADEEDPDSWRFSHEHKRSVRDVYDDDEWDPKTALGGLKLKVQGDKSGVKIAPPMSSTGVALDREGWSGKIEIGLEEEPFRENATILHSTADTAEPSEEFKPEIDIKPNISPGSDIPSVTAVDDKRTKCELEDAEKASSTQPQTGYDSHREPEPTAAASLFKKRRPPPSNRKK